MSDISIAYGPVPRLVSYRRDERHCQLFAIAPGNLLKSVASISVSDFEAIPLGGDAADLLVLAGNIPGGWPAARALLFGVKDAPEKALARRRQQVMAEREGAVIGQVDAGGLTFSAHLVAGTTVTLSISDDAGVFATASMESDASWSLGTLLRSAAMAASYDVPASAP